MTVTYTKTLGRKILLGFLLFAIIFSIAGFFIRNRIVHNLAAVSKLATKIKGEKSKPEHALILLQQAENDFQESLVDANNKKITDYKVKLWGAFGEIDTLLKEKTETGHLTAEQRKQVKSWYVKKVVLSERLYKVKNSFDSLLLFYDDFQVQYAAPQYQSQHLPEAKIESIKNSTDTVVKINHKKGVFGRIRDAIYDKNNHAVVEINRDKSTTQTDFTVQKMAIRERGNYALKLHQLQEKNKDLLKMQRALFLLNNHITSEMEQIINDLKDINYSVADGVKEMVLKNYQETVKLLDRLYLADLFLVIGFALSLAVFIVQLIRSEIDLRRESELSINFAHQKIETLIKEMGINENIQLTSNKVEDLKEVVQLAVTNNPAFLVKFNTFNGEFTKKILELSPNLVAIEIEFCALLYLNFQTKEIARYTKTSVRAVEGKKYRIRKKLNIPSDQDINIWMTQIGVR